MKDILSFLDGFNYALAAFLWIYTLLKYGNLPKIIPIHFGFDGKPDNFGNKVWFLILPVVAIAIFILIYSTDKDISNINFPFKITENNKVKQIFIMQVMSKLVLLIILFLFLNIQKTTFKNSTGNDSKFQSSSAKYIISIIIAIAVFAAYIYR